MKITRDDHGGVLLSMEQPEKEAARELLELVRGQIGVARDQGGTHAGSWADGMTTAADILRATVLGLSTQLPNQQEWFQLHADGQIRDIHEQVRDS